MTRSTGRRQRWKDWIHIRHVVALGFGVVGLGLILLRFLPADKPPGPSEPQLWPVTELPKSIGDKPLSVQVAFPLLLTATSDPLVFTYSGSFPDVLPAMYEIHFIVPPLMGKPPLVVTGTATFRLDGKRRPSGVPGVVVITAAEIKR